jgi:hypothetical protein
MNLKSGATDRSYLLCTSPTTSSLMGAVSTAGRASEVEDSVPSQEQLGSTQYFHNAVDTPPDSDRTLTVGREAICDVGFEEDDENRWDVD